MIQHYIEAMRRALSGVVELATQVAMPLAIFAGFLMVAGVAALFLFRNGQGGNGWPQSPNWRRPVAEAAGYFLVALFLVVAWSALGTTRPMALQDMRWREAAEATGNPAPDAPPVVQTGPAVARLSERVYKRSLTLPREFLRRIGAEGVSVLAPYLTDPTAENVLRQSDTFKRKGGDVVFTREATLTNEEPIPFSSSHVTVNLQRLPGRAYEADFEGHYVFQNNAALPGTVHFLFNLPEAGAIRDLSVKVGSEAVTQPASAAPGSGNPYEWRGEMKAGEQREAVVHYRVVGARTWRYDLGSERRRVQQFLLEANAGGPVNFLRGSLQPTSDKSGNLRWEMSDVVTAQQVGIALPQDMTNQLYLQALSALPAGFALFFIGVLAIGLCFQEMPGSARLLHGLVLFAFGLGAATVLAIYVGPFAGIIVGPLLGALLAAAVLGRLYLLAALPSALVPATFLSEQNSGLLIFCLIGLTLLAVFIVTRGSAPKNSRPTESVG